LQRKKTEFKLEGKVWQPGRTAEPSDRLRQLREQMEPTPEFDFVQGNGDGSTQFGSLRTRSAMLRSQDPDKPRRKLVKDQAFVNELERKLGGRSDDIPEESDTEEEVKQVSRFSDDSQESVVSESKVQSFDSKNTNRTSSVVEPPK